MAQDRMHRPGGLKADGVVIIPATLDTKAEEIAYVSARFEQLGVGVLLVDCGVLGEPRIDADIRREEVAQAAGFTLEALRQQADRAVAIPAMMAGLEAITSRLVADGRVLGVFGLGGGTNANMAAAAFRAAPFGLPKLLVSTVVSGDVRPLVGTKDVLLFHSVVDVLGLNSVLRDVFRRAVAAMVGMLRSQDDHPTSSRTKRPFRVAVTAFGATTKAADHLHALLTARGWEVLTFHARGSGGRAMEELISSGAIDAVIDLTTTEVADEVVGGILSAGPERLKAAAKAGIPMVVLPGAIDLVNFGPSHSLPPRFAKRQTLSHTPTVTLMRSSPEENAAIATFVAERINLAQGSVGVIIPLGGFSAYDSAQGPFFDKAADQAFTTRLETSLAPGIPVEHVAAHINDPVVAEKAVAMLSALIDRHQTKAPVA